MAHLYFDVLLVMLWAINAQQVAEWLINATKKEKTNIYETIKDFYKAQHVDIADYL